MEPFMYPAHKLAGMLERGHLSSVELTESVLGRIERSEPDLNAYITVMGEEALRQAREADRRIAAGDTGPFTGIPVAVKDIISMEGAPTTCGSKMLENCMAVYDAGVVEKLRMGGAVLVGKTNMDEFAMGSSGETSHFGPTRNPWNPEYVPGGSSSGSAAATAARECIVSLGSDTGGSIRQPASHCGVVGMKPTYGRVSRYGLVAFASSLDQIGPITLDVRDCALLLREISGYDRRDSTSVPEPVPDFPARMGTGVEGLRVGIPNEYFEEGLDSEVRDTVNRAIGALESMGARIREVSLPHTEYGGAAYYIIAPAEASSNLARYDGVRYGLRTERSVSIEEMYSRTRSEGFGAEVKRRIVLGAYSLSAGYYDAYYRKASQVRALMIEDFRAAFDVCDVLVTPVAPTPAFHMGEKTRDPLAMYLGDVFTLPANLAGIPAVSLPYGVSVEGFPIGVQILGNHFDEETVLRAAFALEQERGEWEGEFFPLLKPKSTF